jgi:hypothetical protein
MCKRHAGLHDFRSRTCDKTLLARSMATLRHLLQKLRNVKIGLPGQQGLAVAEAILLYQLSYRPRLRKRVDLMRLERTTRSNA